MIMEKIELIFFALSRIIVKGSAANSGAGFMGKGEVYDNLYPKYMKGELTLEDVLKQTYEGWEGLGMNQLSEVYQKLEFKEDAKEVIRQIKAKGIKIAMLT